MKTKHLQIAIDGPAAAGKGTISGLLAHKLGTSYFYTGAMYRALAFSCIQNNISVEDEKAVVRHLDKIRITLSSVKKNKTVDCRVLLDNQDVTIEVITPQVALSSSQVAKYKKVRERMVSLQQKLAKNKSVVMEGRDIALKVLPKAQLKIYVTATVEQRAERIHRRFRKKNINISYEKVLEDVVNRDERDKKRAIDPLKKLDGVFVLDTTGAKAPDMVEVIVKELERKKLL